MRYGARICDIKDYDFNLVLTVRFCIMRSKKTPTPSPEHYTNNSPFWKYLPPRGVYLNKYSNKVVRTAFDEEGAIDFEASW